MNKYFIGRTMNAEGQLRDTTMIWIERPIEFRKISHAQTSGILYLLKLRFK